MDELLDELTPEEFNERFAYWQLCGGGQYWDSLAAVLAEISNLIPRYVQTKSEKRVDRSMFRKLSDFVPSLFRTRTQKPKRTGGKIMATDADAADRTARMLGL